MIATRELTKPDGVPSIYIGSIPAARRTQSQTKTNRTTEVVENIFKTAREKNPTASKTLHKHKPQVQLPQISESNKVKS